MIPTKRKFRLDLEWLGIFPLTECVWVYSLNSAVALVLHESNF